MISADLNQLLKKNKTPSTPAPSALSSRLLPRALVSSPSNPRAPRRLRRIMSASHVEKRDYLRHGIENAAQASLSDARLPRFWSGFRFDIVPFRLSLSPPPLPPSSSIFAVAAGSRPARNLFRVSPRHGYRRER